MKLMKAFKAMMDPSRDRRERVSNTNKDLTAPLSGSRCVKKPVQVDCTIAHNTTASVRDHESAYLIT
jgi:hypothetical protein